VSPAGWAQRSLVERPEDAFGDIVKVLIRVRGWESQDTKSLRLEVGRLPLIGSFLVMFTSVDLDDEPGRQAYEIDEVGSDG